MPLIAEAFRDAQVKARAVWNRNQNKLGGWTARDEAMIRAYLSHPAVRREVLDILSSYEDALAADNESVVHVLQAIGAKALIPEALCATCGGLGRERWTELACCGATTRHGECRVHCAVPVECDGECPDCKGSGIQSIGAKDTP